ncbi:acyl-CoA-binding protein [Hymenobacter sp. DH14]|uniref:Acyl-CoA-binding protein n=1 Tax=Hymenobacter cyanobacteriorum TaxID=2926463 RepID=A0A9X2AG59_9BACT|nr:acyl-CoA-binding protein [Hymenobacter cyanobacteriorum]MCI1188886.1 acyl-CoA-binding protein [Hymenobacter cyanobacteriorum]
MDLNAQFQAAADKVNNLPGDVAAQHMTELYGLYKQATEGDVNMKNDEVDASAADQASGPAGLSQAQWDSWNQFKGVSEEEAKRRYVARTNEITGAAGSDKTGGAAEAGEVPTDGLTGAPASGDHGGLKGDIKAGTPYGGEDKLKGQQA